MQKSTSLFKQKKIYFSALVAIFIFSICYLLINGKEAGFISLSSYHPFWLNVFFINYTFMGNGIFAICLIGFVLFYFKRKKLGFGLLYAFFISGIATQILKNLFNSSGPKLYFEAGTYLNFVDGVTVSGNSDFTSGHTATAFAIATVLVLLLKSKNLQLLILMGAALVGYSRIYLAQHFLLDVIVGACLGSMSGIAAVYFANNIIGLKWSFKKIHRLPVGESPNAIQTA